MLQKTVHAPYYHGHVAVFGENAGQQCVAMSLCALSYSKIRRITSVDDMIQVLIVGNQLYYSLSLLERQYVNVNVNVNMCIVGYKIHA